MHVLQLLACLIFFAPVVLCETLASNLTLPGALPVKTTTLNLGALPLGTLVIGQLTAVSSLQSQTGLDQCRTWDDQFTVQITPALKGRLSALTVEGIRKLCLEGQFFTGRHVLRNPCRREPWISRQGLDSLATLRYQWDDKRSMWTEDRFETVYVRMDHPDTLVFVAEPPTPGQLFMYRVLGAACIEFY